MQHGGLQRPPPSVTQTTYKSLETPCLFLPLSLHMLISFAGEPSISRTSELVRNANSLLLYQKFSIRYSEMGPRHW